MSVTTPATPVLSFERLVAAIGQAHAELAAQASRAVNSSLTLRNWLIGFHIAEYEQQGTDRAQYGDKLIERLSNRLIQAGISRAEARELRRYRQFYLTYPQIRESLSPELGRPLLPQTDASNNRESLFDFCSAPTGLKMGFSVPGADKHSLTHWSDGAGQFDLGLCAAPG